MRILYFASSHKIGLTALLAGKARHLHRRDDHRFLFIAGEGEQFKGLLDELKQIGASVAIIPGLDNHSHFGRLVNQLSRLLREFSPDVIHAQTNWQLALAVAARSLAGLRPKIAYTIHGYRHNRQLGSLVARVLMGLGLHVATQIVFVPSTFVKKRFSFLGSKCRLLFLGVDDAMFERDLPPGFDGTVRVVFGGEFRPGKNQELVIRAVWRYSKLDNPVPIEVYLPGSGARLERCKALAARLGVDGEVHFPGSLTREAMLALYGKCQFAVAPANVETFGLCVAEPMALGRVVLTRRVGVAEDVIREGENGFFFTDDTALSGLLHELAGKVSICETVARNARASSSVFRWDAVCSEYLRALENLIGSGDRCSERA